MKQTSGLEALLDALKQSGVDVDGAFGRDGDDGSSVVDVTPEDSEKGGSKSSSGEKRQSKRGGKNKGGGSAVVETPFSAAVAQWGRRTLVVAAIVVIIAALAAYWWFHPPINIQSVDTWTFMSLFILLPLFFVLRAKSGSAKGSAKRGAGSSAKASSTGKVLRGASYVPLIIIAFGLVGALASQSFFPGNAEKYASVLKTDTLDFASDIHEVDYSEIPVIDRNSAVLLGNREMGSIPEYVSQFEISPLYSQINYHGAPVRVSPLGYEDLFKWLTNRQSGIPAYSLVNMTTQDAEIVRLEDNPIYYSQSEPLVRNIDRHVQLSYPFYMFDQKSFEIDEEGQPWWVCPVQTRTIGLFGGTTISRVVMCNATTGECTDLPIDEVPEWVDRAYPSELLLQQYNWSGCYKDGWLNSWLGQSGVVQTTPGSDGELGYNYLAKDDDVWVYTGVTSATADNSIVGFVLVNQRTAESHYYSVSGATEESAMKSAEGQVQNLRYSATFPLLINVSNQPTYFMALKDDAGLVKQFAMIDIQRYQNVAVGDTVESCQESYERLLSTNGVSTADKGETASVAKGSIERIAQAVVEGNSHFYVKLAKDDRLYDFALPDQIEIVGYAEGDEIEFTFVDAKPTCPVKKFGSDDEKDKKKADGAASDAGADSNAGSGDAGAADSGNDVSEKTSENGIDEKQVSA